MEKMVLVPYDKYKRMLEPQSFMAPTTSKPTKKKDQMPCQLHGKRDASTHCKSEADVVWLSFNG